MLVGRMHFFTGTGRKTFTSKIQNPVGFPNIYAWMSFPTH